MPDMADEISDLFVGNLIQGRKSFLLFLRGMLRQTLGSFWGEPCPTHGGELIEESEETQQ